MPEIRVSINLDKLTLGDFENIQRGRLMSLLNKCVSVQGWKDTQDIPIIHLKTVTDKLLETINAIKIDEMISPVPLDDIEVLGIEAMNFGDMASIENGSLETFRKYIKVNSYESIDDVPFKAIVLIREKLQDAISLATNPNS